jgi:CRP-like cAMP-binding protein/ActR/RegA family two-component response regulator
MRKILVIEDQFEIRENLKEILTLSGYDVITANDGKEGIKKSLDANPDLILCDIIMPNLDGFGTLEILNNNRKTAGIPVIFLTAMAEKEDFRKGMSLGAFDYITKPFDDVTLLKTIETRLEKFELLKKASVPQTGSFDQFISEARGVDALNHLPDNCEMRQYRKNDLLYQEGQLPFWLFYVEEGRIKTFRTSDDGRDLITNIHNPGDFVGYLDLLQNSPYTENAAAMETVKLKLIPKADFLSLVFGNHDVAFRFIKMLANHVTEREERLLHLAYHSVRKRVADALVKLAAENEGQIRMFRGDLASIIGAAKETLIRTLSEFKSEGLIDINGEILTLLKPEKLQALRN